jgi:hypothetical protein
MQADTFLNGARFAADCVCGSTGCLKMRNMKNLTRWTRMTTLKGLGTRFITWKSGAYLRIYLSDNESETKHQVDIPIHRQLDIRDEHTSMDTLPNTGHR